MGEWRSARRHAGALAWTGLDQAFSTLSNVVVSLALARGAGASGLGAFTVVFGAYLIVLGFQRTLIADPLLASPLKIGDREAERAALGAAIIFSTIGALAVLGLGAILGRSEFVALALVLPFVCVQDLLRYVAFRRLDARTATMLDLAWTAVSVSAWWLIRAGSLDRAVLLWGAGGALGMVLGMFLLRLVPAGIRAAWRWWKCDARVFGLALSIEGVVYTVTAQAWVFIVAGALGSADLGALRAAQLLLAPSAPLLAAFSTFALPRMARRAAELTPRDSQLASLAALALAAPLVVAPLVAARPLTRLLYGSSFSVPSPAVDCRRVHFAPWRRGGRSDAVAQGSTTWPTARQCSCRHRSPGPGLCGGGPRCRSHGGRVGAALLKTSSISWRSGPSRCGLVQLRSATSMR